MRKKGIWWTAGVLVTAGIVVGLLLFEPWKAFTSSELHEPSPLAEQTSASPAPRAEQVEKPKPRAKQLAQGSFVSQEHETTGTAKVIRRADGRVVLRFEGLASSDGPDLYVWLTDRKAGLQEWGAYDDGRYVDLGSLKATHGEQNYLLPRGTKLDGLRSVVIWCDRFSVAFGSAELKL